jgi:hypothetical protein
MGDAAASLQCPSGDDEITEAERVQLDKDKQLFKACHHSNFGEIEALLNRGASVFATDESGCTALLDVADRKGNDANGTDIAELLLDFGSEVNALTNYHTTPLHWTCYHNKQLMSTLLLERGADPNIQNTIYGESPLHHACARGPLDLALLLIRFGASVYLIDNEGKTPLDKCDVGKLKIGRHIVEKAYVHEQKWQRRKAFVIFLTAIYGSRDFQSKQQMLLPPHKPREKMKEAVRSTNVDEWKAITKVLCVRELNYQIAAYL